MQHFTSLHREGESGEKRQVEGSVGRERVLRGECRRRRRRDDGVWQLNRSHRRGRLMQGRGQGGNLSIFVKGGSRRAAAPRPRRIWTGWPSCSAALLPRCARPLGRGSGKGEASGRGQRGVGL